MYSGKYLDHVVDASGKATYYAYGDEYLQSITDADGNKSLINWA